MNPNIEVITPVLWGAYSGQIKAGWIKELVPLDGVSDTNKYASLTSDGIMILKKESEFYDVLKKFVPRVMSHTHRELQKCLSLRNKASLDNYEKMYLNIVEWEIKRRRVRALYMLRNPLKIFIIFPQK